jgi:hypothetical protein
MRDFLGDFPRSGLRYAENLRIPSIVVILLGRRIPGGARISQNAVGYPTCGDA